MALHMKWSDRSKQLLPTGEQARETVLEFLRHRYVREKQLPCAIASMQKG